MSPPTPSAKDRPSSRVRSGREVSAEIASMLSSVRKLPRRCVAGFSPGARLAGAPTGASVGVSVAAGTTSAAGTVAESARLCSCSRPSSMRITRRAAAATSGSWVITSTVQPVALMRCRISMTLALLWLSRLPVGSSARISGGRVARARAMAQRCFSPPERYRVRMLARSLNPRNSRVSSVRCRRSP